MSQLAARSRFQPDEWELLMRGFARPAALVSMAEPGGGPLVGGLFASTQLMLITSTSASALAALAGYDAQGDGKLAQAFDLLVNLGQVHLASLAVGLLTLALALTLPRTRLGSFGTLGALLIPSLAVAFGLKGVATVGDIATIPQGLPAPDLPSLAVLVKVGLNSIGSGFESLGAHQYITPGQAAAPRRGTSTPRRPRGSRWPTTPWPGPRPSGGPTAAAARCGPSSPSPARPAPATPSACWACSTPATTTRSMPARCWARCRPRSAAGWSPSSSPAARRPRSSATLIEALHTRLEHTRNTRASPPFVSESPHTVAHE